MQRTVRGNPIDHSDLPALRAQKIASQFAGGIRALLDDLNTFHRNLNSSDVIDSPAPKVFVAYGPGIRLLR
jgi:hypothetical protein